MRALLVAMVISGCAPAIKCVAQEGFGELPEARSVQLAPLNVESVDADQREACRRAFREAALARMKTSWPRVQVVESGADLTLAATLENASGTLRGDLGVLENRTGKTVRETQFTTRADSSLIEICRAFGGEIIDARRGCPAFY